MAKQIPQLMYREHCIKQGRDNIKPLTRRQAKALRQHNEAKAKNPNVGTESYGTKRRVELEPRFNILGELVALVPKSA